MSKLRSQNEYEKTSSFRFWQWLEGEKDPYIDNVEMKVQEEFHEFPIQVRKREIDHIKLHDKIYDIDHNKEIKFFQGAYRVSAVVLCSVIMIALVLCASYLPKAGSPDNPSVNEVAERYVEQGTAETGVINTVTGMILNYRGFDTFGETCVLFIASSCVMILLMVSEEKLKNLPKNLEPKDDKILQYVARIIVPVLMIFGFYVIVNGPLSPGGGFSGGAIIGAGLILYVNAYGFEKASRIMNRKNYAVISVVPLLFYAVAKGYSFFTGANHLESGIPKGAPGAILSGGLILPLNICVGIVVACTMYHFYTLFRKGGM